jgi:hypothetical protein
MIGDTTFRSHQGWGSAGAYTNTTGRNDIVTAKVARDQNNIYFFVSTAANLTPRTDEQWMMLFIDADCDGTNGWHGYDYLINGTPLNALNASLKHTTGGWNWTEVAQVPFRMSGNKMEISVQRSALGVPPGSKITFDFHWADNIQHTDDITEFFMSGDSAPDRRFNYRYDADNPAPVPLTNFFAVRTQREITLSWTNPSNSTTVGTLVRLRTDHFPSTPSDGVLICDKPTSGATDSFVLNPISRSAPYYFAAFSYDCRGINVPAGQMLVQRLAIADLDADGDVDQTDFGMFQACLLGPGLIQSDPGCDIADLDGDLDVDLIDYLKVEPCFSGPNIPAFIECAP